MILDNIHINKQPRDSTIPQNKIGGGGGGGGGVVENFKKNKKGGGGGGGGGGGKVFENCSKINNCGGRLLNTLE